MKKTHKYLSLILAAALLAAVLLIPSSALRGRWEGLTWTITDGTLTVAGGDIPDSTAYSAAPWMKFAHLVEKITVGQGVTLIGDRAFEDMTRAKTADLGTAISIGEMAFSGCASLTSVTVPDSVMYIGDFAFAECASLRTATLPKRLTSFGEGVFEACYSLRSIDGGSDRFYTVSGILMDKNTRSILRYPPAKTDGSYTASAEILTVAKGAFRDAASLTSVTLPQVISIGDGAFYGCSALESVEIPKTETVGRATFYGCASLEEIRFGKSLASLGDNAFAYSTSLGIADFPGNAPDASEGVFLGCSSAFTVTVEESSKGFGDGDSWLGYPLLRHGKYEGDFDNGRLVWSLDSRTGILTVTGMGAIPDFGYASDAPWYEYRRVIRSIELNGITKIGDNAFRYSSVTSLTVPESVSAIGKWAFSGCQYLKSVTVSGKTAIGECAFFGCTDLTVAKLTSVTAIGKQAFSGCTALEYVITGKTAPALSEFAFDGTDAAVLIPKDSTGYTDGEWANVYTETYLPGDANGDGKTNITDVSHMMKYLAGWSDITVKKLSADVNSDGKVNINDAALLLKYLAGWDVTIGFTLN